MALLLMHANATVTICHSKTRDLADVVRRADIVVAAMGKAGYVQADWIKPGAAVIDVGTNRVTDAAEAEKLLKNFPQEIGKVSREGECVDWRCASGCGRLRREGFRRCRAGWGQ